MGTNQALDTDIVEFVRLGYSDVSLYFRIHVHNRSTFDATTKAVGGYNNFDPRQVAETIGPVFDDAMQVEFGRESPPVLYVGIPYFRTSVSMRLRVSRTNGTPTSNGGISPVA